MNEVKDFNLLQHKEVPGIQIQSPLVFATSDGNFYLYFCVNGNLYSFNADTKANLLLPAPSIASSRVSCIAISPQHTLAAAGYEDGSVSFFDITSNKHIKNVSKVGKNKITKCTFIGDSSLVVTDSSLNLIHLSISFGLFGISIKETILTTFNTFPNQLLSPPCYKFVGDSTTPQKVSNQSHCISQSFGQVIGISLFNKVIIASVVPSNYKIIAEFSAEKPILSLSLPNPDMLYVAYASSNKITICSINNDNSSKEIHTQNLTSSPQFISFLSPSIIALIYEDYSVSLFSFLISNEDSAKLELRGLLMSDNDSLKIMTPKTIYSLYLLTFFDQIELFREKSDIESAISFCKRAYQNDPDAIVGLPSNDQQRSLIIEQSLSSFLELNVKERLSNGESAEKVAEDIINISKELSMQEWVINEAPQFFRKSSALLKTFVNKVVQSDPNADFFNYTPKFVNLIVENCVYTDISHFLNALPSKVVKNQVLLQYALDHHDFQLAKDVYLKRLQDPIGALNIYEIKNDLQSICDVLSNFEEGESSRIISWIYAMRKEKGNVDFPRLEMVIKLPIEQSCPIFEKIFDANKPFSNDAFINSTLNCFSKCKITSESKLFKLIENFIITNEFTSLTKSSMAFLLSCIFTEKFISPDNRETLLIRVLDVPQNGLQKEFTLSLIPLCNVFSFKKSRQWINQNLHMYGNILQEIINDDVDDPFDWIMKNTNQNSKDQIIETIQSNASLLAIKNSEKLAKSLTLFDNNQVVNILNCIQDKDTKYFYIHNLVKLNLGDHLFNESFEKDNKMIVINSITFMCKYFPDDVFPFLDKHADKLQIENKIIKNELISSCETNGLTDCCAFVCMKANDRKKIMKYLRELIIKDVIKYEKLITNTVDFIFNSANEEEEDEEEDAADDDESESENIVQNKFFFIARSFLEPMTKCSQDEIDEIAHIYREICEIIFNSSINHRSKDVLLKLESIVRYSHSMFLRIGGEKFPRILRVLIYGQKFNVKQAASIKSVLVNALLDEDELSQLTCAKCKLRLFVDDTGIIILNCGHAIHDSKFCTKNLDEGCPICKELHQ